MGALGASFSGAFGKIRNSSKPLFFQWFLMVLGLPGGSQIEPKWLRNRSCPRLGISWRSLGAFLASLGGLLALLGPLGRLLGRSWGDFKLQHKTWLSWNGKRVLRESCKHCKRLTTKPQSIKKAFSSSFAGALRAPAQRFELGLRLERLSHGRSQRIASNKEKSFENGSKMPPRRLQNRSQIASKWLPEASRAPPKSGIDNWILFCSFRSPLGRLLGRSWVALGRSWRCLGASWVAPGRSRGAPGGHFRPPGVSFWSLLGIFFEAF